MATATNSTLGEIVLGGDLTGAADSPQLISTGVTPGTYAPVQRIVVDSKGRIVAIGNVLFSDIQPLLSTASSSVKGIFSIGFGLAASSQIAIKFSDLIATGSVFGAVKSGTNLTNTAGVLSIPDATSSVKGVASFGSDFVVTSGAVAIMPSSVVPNIPTATGSAFGVVKSGTNLTNTAGVLSIPDATSSVKGVASFGSDFVVTSGAVAINPAAAVKTAVANTYTATQKGTLTAITGVSSYTPDFQNGTFLSNITLTSNLTINFPAVLAPAGTLVRHDIALRFNAGLLFSVTLDPAYVKNKTFAFTNALSAGVDVLTLLCTSTECFAFLNETFV